MRPIQTTLAALLLTAIALPATAQVYRCKGPSGGIELQQTPCAGQGGTKLDVRPASGHAPEPAATPTGPTAAQAYEHKANELQAERIRREKWFEADRQRKNVASVKAACDREQRQIGAEKAYSNNNLAGAMRDVSITNEMQAAALRCQTRIADAQRDLDAAEAHCQKISCIAPNW